MAEPDNRRNDKGEEKLYTLSEVSKKSGISMPTLQRYKKLYQGRIPSVGTGRKQRYPDSALPVFDELKQENIGRRGRPRKDASAAAGPRRAARGGRAAAAAPARRGRPPGSGRAAAKAPRGAGRADRGGLLTLTQISKDTGISYPTLVRYVRMHANRLPHEGKGRARRFHPAAVDVFRELRQQSGRGGRRPGTGAGRRVGRPAGSGGEGALAGRLKVLEKSQEALEKRFRILVASLGKLFK